MADDRDGGGDMRCPHCAAPLEAQAEERAGVVHCAACGGPVMLDDEPPPADDLDGLRIRQVYQLRRSLYRARRYWLVGVGICFVAGGQILWKLFTSSTGSMGISSRHAIVLAVAFIIGGMICLRQALRLGRSARRSLLNEPERPPDLSTLSDGSQYWKNLEGMGRREAGEEQ